MKLSLHTTLLVSAILAATTAHAKTFKYELTDINSNNGVIQYPGLDFNGATAATLTVEQDAPGAEPQIKSLVIEFPHANNLVVRDFKHDGGEYRALVNNAWIYRQVAVTLHSPDLNPYNHAPVNIDVSVSEQEGFINNGSGSAQPAQPLLMTFGMLTDITPAKTVDTASVVIGGKRLNLALRSNLSTPAPFSGSGEGGFIVEANWMGKGAQTLYVPSSVPREAFGFISPVSLKLDALEGPNGIEYMLSITAKDHNGAEMPTQYFPLNDLLMQAYGPQF